MKSLKNFFREKWLEIAITALILQLLTSALSISLGNKPWIIVLIAIGLILIIITIMVASELISKRREIPIYEDPSFLKFKRKGIIFTIGLKSHDPGSTVMKAIIKLKPEFYGFLGTELTHQNKIVDSIIRNSELDPNKCREKIVAPTNIKEIREDTEHLIDWMLKEGLLPDDIVVDLTGGTAVMSVAAYMAAYGKGIPSQYIYSEYKDNKPIEGTQRALIIG